MGNRIRALLSGLITVFMTFGCSTDKEDDSDLQALDRNEKVAALSAFLPWLNLRDALDRIAATSREASLNEDSHALASELMKLCAVRHSPHADGAFASSEDKTTRTDTFAVGPNGSKPNCPIRYHETIVRERKVSGDEQITKSTVKAEYRVLSDRALMLTPVVAMRYEGTVKASSGQNNRASELVHSIKESHAGEFELQNEKPIEIRWKRQAQTRFRGVESLTSETNERFARIGRRSIEWRQEREFTDLKLSSERCFLNHEEIASDEYEKLKLEAARKSRAARL